MAGRTWRRLAEITGLWAVAVGQPLLDVFGRSTETFIFRDVGAFGYVVFGVMILGAPPLLLWAMGELVGRLAPARRDAAHDVTVAGLGALAALVALRLIAELQGLWLVAPAVAVGALLVAARRRFDGVAQFLVWLAVLPLVSLGWYVAVAPASSLLATSETNIEEDEASDTPVVMLVLDEFPTTTLLDDEGGVDARRYPNLAGLADESAWYRNYTTLSGSTVRAVPTILTGNIPERGDEPLWTDRPDNLFTALAPSHRLRVRESVTQLCPPQLCDSTDDLTLTETAGSSGVLALLGDAVQTFEQIVDPRSEPRVAVDAFTEDVVSLDPLEAPDDTTGAPAVQPTRFTAFVDDIVESDQSVLNFLHLILPHGPWRFTDDGTQYEAPEVDPPGQVGGVWTDDWPAELTAFRLELQARYTDRLVGQTVERLQDQGLWDRAVFVVVSDHGGSFRSGDRGRALTDTNAAGVMWTPLFIRAPGLATGPTDVNAQAIDVLPTIADLVDEPLDFEVDGESLVRRTGRLATPIDGSGGGGGDKIYARFSNAFQPEDDAVLDIDGNVVFEEVLDAGRTADRAEVDEPIASFHRATPLGARYGRPVVDRDLGPEAAFRITIDQLETLEDGSGTDPLPAFVQGTLRGGRRALGDEPWIALAVDGEFGGFSPLYESIDGSLEFALLLDPARLDPDGNEITAYLAPDPDEPLQPVPFR